MRETAEPERGSQPFKIWGSGPVGFLLLTAFGAAALFQSVWSLALRIAAFPAACAGGGPSPIPAGLCGLGSWLTLEALSIGACDGRGVPRLRRWLRWIMRVVVLIAVIFLWRLHRLWSHFGFQKLQDVGF